MGLAELSAHWVESPCSSSLSVRWTKSCGKDLLVWSGELAVVLAVVLWVGSVTLAQPLGLMPVRAPRYRLDDPRLVFSGEHSLER